MNKIKTIFAIALLSMLFGMNVTAEGSSLEDAFKNGKVKGKAQLYYESQEEKDNGRRSDGFAVATLTLGYETAKWNDFKFGATAFAASQLYDHGEEFGDDFDAAGDEDNVQAALSEIYLKYYFAEKSFIQAGRWNHKKVTRKHFEEDHSEGVNIQFNEVEGLSLNAGIVTQVGEFNYDDLEHYGDDSSENDNDFSDDNTYGDAAPVVLFVDALYDINENFSINPYVYYQDDYAAVYGSDFKFKTKLSEDTKTGLNATAYAVETMGQLEEESGSGSVVLSAQPWVSFGGLKLAVGFTHFNHGVVRPQWFNDYLGRFDQDNQEPGGVDADGDGSTTDNFSAIHAIVQYKIGKFKLKYGIQQWDGGGNVGNDDGAEELEQEFIVNYKVTKAFDAELRFFHVEFDNANDTDYDRIEARLRYKF